MKEETFDNIISDLQSKYVIHESNHEDYKSIRIMCKDGSSFARACIYHNDPSCICLSDLYVQDDFRNKGEGKYLQEVRENIGISLGCDTALLSVKKNSWMFEWYERRGYEYYMDDIDNYLFMTKKLN